MEATPELLAIAKFLMEQKVRPLMAQSSAVRDSNKNTGKSEFAEQYEKAILFTHVASVAYINQVAEKVQRKSFGGSNWERELSREVEIPIQDKWDLKLGDEVRIKYKLAEFKAIQKKTVGWKKQWRQALDLYGFIITTCNEYDRHVRVYFPKIDMKCELYAGVLEKNPHPSRDCKFRFKPGSIVSLNSGRQVVELLQNGYNKLTDDELTEKGRVVVATNDRVFVAFDGLHGTEINPALLKLEKGCDKLPNRYDNDCGGFEIGDKVKLIPNLRKVIEQQRNHRGWNNKMIELLNGDVIVLLKKKDNTLRVCDPLGYSWDFNAKSLLPKDDTPEDDQDEDVPFKIGDQVRIKHVPNIRQFLKGKDIPLSILEYIKLPAKVSTYNNDLEAGIQYNPTSNIFVNSSVLEVVAGAKHHGESSDTKQDLKQGDKVHLNVGPPNYVRAVLEKIDADEKVIKALTTSGVIQGFKGTDQIIIKYSDGEQYKINKKHVTLPSTYSIRFRDNESKFSWDNVPEVTSVLKICLHAIHDGDWGRHQLDDGIDSISLVRGQPPILDVKITSPIATYDNLLETLREKSGWEIEDICEGVIDVKALPESKTDIRIEFFINEDEKKQKYAEERGNEPTKKKIEDHSIPELFEQGEYIGNVIHEEPSEVLLKAIREPTGDHQPPNLREGDLGDVAIPTSHRGFRLMQLSDETLSRTILFPYILIDGRASHRVQYEQRRWNDLCRNSPINLSS